MGKKILLLVLSLVVLSGLAFGCSGGEEKKEGLKIGLAMAGSKSDGGWNQVAYDALLKAEKELGADIYYQENTKPADFESTLRNYAKDGCDLIIGHGYAFGDPALKLGEEYPDIDFIVVSSDVANGKNVGSVNENYYESGFLQGAFAGLMSKTGKVGTVGGMEIPSIMQQLVGYEAGAKYVKSDITVLSAAIGNFDDINKAKEQSITFIEQGADMLMMDANIAGRGGYDAGKERGVYNISTIQSEFEQFPDIIIGCGFMDTSESIYQSILEVHNGDFKGESILKGVKDGVSKFIINPALQDKVPADVQEKMKELEGKFRDGSLDVMEFIKE